MSDLSSVRDYNLLLPIIIDKLFPEHAQKLEIQKLLAEYKHLEGDRVRLGILKASNGNIAKIKSLIEIANYDFRDLLCIAEYPYTSKKWGLKEKSPERYLKLQQKEQDEYDSWINSLLEAKTPF